MYLLYLKRMRRYEKDCLFSLLEKKDKLNYDILNINSFDAPELYFDDYAEVPGYNVFEGDEYSSEKYGNILLRAYNYCKDDFYATIEYEVGQIEYKFTVKDGIAYLNGENINNLINRYNILKMINLVIKWYQMMIWNVIQFLNYLIN